MGDTFDKMQDRKDEAQQINRCQLIVEFMQKELNDEQRKDLCDAFKWIHIMQPGVIAAEEDDDEWAGRIKVIRELVSSLDSKVTKLSTKIDIVQTDAATKMDHLTDVQQRQTQILHDIMSKVDNLSSVK